LMLACICTNLAYLYKLSIASVLI